MNVSKADVRELTACEIDAVAGGFPWGASQAAAIEAAIKAAKEAAAKLGQAITDHGATPSPFF